MLLTLLALRERVPQWRAQAYSWLDKRLFSWIVAYAIHPLHICALLGLWTVMLLGGSNTMLELILGNYTNGLSALVACILLMRQMEHHHRQHASLDELHAKVDALASRKPRTRKAQP